MIGPLIKKLRDWFGRSASAPSDIDGAREVVRRAALRTTELNEKLEPYLAANDPLSALMFDLQLRRDRLARGE